MTRPRDVAADAELFNFLAENAQEYVHKLKQVGAGRCGVGALLLRRLESSRCCAGLGGAGTCLATHCSALLRSTSCFQGGRAHSAADLLRRLKTRFVEDVDAQLAGADDPDAFDWCAAGGLAPDHAAPALPATLVLAGMVEQQTLLCAYRPATLLTPSCRAGLGQGRSVAVLFRSVPATHHMLGPLDAQPRQRRAIQRQAKRKAPVGERQRRRGGGPGRRPATV